MSKSVNTIKECTFEYAGKKWEIDYREDDRRRSIAYVWGAGDDVSEDELVALAKQHGLDNAFTKRGKYPDIDKAWDRHNRRIVAEKRAVLDVALVALGVKPGTVSPSFSRKAGCRCGCSPGFYLNGIGNFRILFIQPYEPKKSKKQPEPQRDLFAEDLAQRRAGL